MALDADTLIQFTNTLERFVHERLIPLEAQVSEEDEIPAEVIEEMKEIGLFGMTIPEAYGGLGLSTEEECTVVQVLGRTSPAFRSVFGTNNGIGSQGLVMDGTEEQKAHYLPKMATGEIIGSFALTEPDVGSDSGAVKTQRRREGDDYRAERHQALYHQCARSSAVHGLRPDQSRRSRSQGRLRVPGGCRLPGITLGPKNRKMGQQGAHVWT